MIRWGAMARCALFFGAAVVLLTGCATVETRPITAQQTVYALEGEYAAALAVGAAYNELPRCRDAGPKLCSDPARVGQLRLAVRAANTSLLSVESTVRSGGDAVAALLVASEMVRTLTILTADLKVKP